MTDISRLAINSKELRTSPPDRGPGIETTERRILGRFLRGPIPWNWLTVAGKLPGRALHLAMVIWHLEGFQRTGTVKLKPSLCRELGMDRSASYRALKELEDSGLVSVTRKKGVAAVVTINAQSRQKVGQRVLPSSDLRKT
jgi:hypothetical protein